MLGCFSICTSDDPHAGRAPTQTQAGLNLVQPTQYALTRPKLNAYTPSRRRHYPTPPAGTRLLHRSSSSPPPPRATPLATMLQSKSFVKKTKQGRIQKVSTRQHHHLARPPQTLPDAVALSPQYVREHYLRDDVYCGFVPCTACDAAAERKLDAAAAAILVVDTNVVLHQVSKAFPGLQLSLLVGYNVEGVEA